jgi:hypothetical protein
MALSAPDGGVHDCDDVVRWMTEAGFRDTVVSHLPPPLPHSVVVGRKG